MEMIFRVLGNASGALGAALCLLAGAMRLSGGYYLAGVSTGTVFEVGIAMMVFACLMKLQQLTMSRSGR